MPGCSAPYCTRRTEKGFRMFRFPRDPTRFRRWVLNCPMETWEPSSTSCLCEYHFDASQFESRRQDGWRKLKPNAEPTIFDIPVKISCENLPPPNKNRKKKDVILNSEKQNLDPVRYCTVGIQPEEENQTGWRRPNILRKRHLLKKKNILVQKKAQIDETPFDNSSDNVVMPEDSADVRAEVSAEAPHMTEETITSSSVDLALHAAEEKIKFLETKVWMLQKKLTAANKSVRECQNLLKKFPFLTADQVQILTTGQKKVNWSQESIKQALQIRSAVGWKGYRKLLKLKLPLPAYSTLYKKMKDVSPECNTVSATSCTESGQAEVVSTPTKLIDLGCVEDVTSLAVRPGLEPSAPGSSSEQNAVE